MHPPAMAPASCLGKPVACSLGERSEMTSKRLLQPSVAPPVRQQALGVALIIAAATIVLIVWSAPGFVVVMGLLVFPAMASTGALLAMPRAGVKDSSLEI